MEIFNSYTIVIIASMIVIVSYLFNIISSKTGVPSVLLLIGLGMIFRGVAGYMDISFGTYLFDALEILGIVGLIMIVLEAALDLELNRSKWPVISKSFLVAFASLIISSFVIALIIQYLIVAEFMVALVYAIPLSIISSAIIIPSIGELSKDKREFMIYESTFSDILGIMYFYFLLGNLDNENVGDVVWDIASNIVMTIVLSVVISYALVLIFQRLKTQVKLFLLVAVLLLLYSIGKIFHLSSLLIILIFGLVINNYKVFFRGKLAKLINLSALHSILGNFHLVTMESAFVIRTFFFVIFGLSIDLSSLLDTWALLVSIIIVISLFGVRALFLKLVVKENLNPQLFMAPRGLITILLFFSIPTHLQLETFSSAILLYTILITSSAMAIALIASGKHLEPVEAVQLEYWQELDKEIDEIPKQEKHKTFEEKVIDQMTNEKDEKA
ncbi:cation:proton antiporter [Fulvivirga sp.]|uniref:cation:proton antiporter domain-containing protein n=1 Tax=Fulvivirga sp. TaxID=1931237 RepID=UPI0032EFA664